MGRIGATDFDALQPFAIEGLELEHHILRSSIGARIIASLDPVEDEVHA